MTTISKELRDAIRAAAEKATPGPWLSRPYKNDDWGMVREGKSLWPVAIVRAGRLLGAEESNDCRVNGIDPFEDNAAHIANCDPQTILALLDALDAAEKAEPAAVKPLEWGGGDMPLRDRELRAIVDALAASPEAK